MENIMEIKDSKIIKGILNKAFITVALQFNYTKENAPKFPAFIESNIIENGINNGLKMYGYYLDNQIIGCIGYSFYKDNMYFIERLATLPEYRHKGIGKTLMEYVENKIKENDGEIIEIHVVDEIKTLPFNSYVMNKILE